jgi:cyclic pyranopterin phosphate synthase
MIPNESSGSPSPKTLAILCGGKSSRLGTDKGLYAPLGDETLVARQIRLLGKHFSEILVIVRDPEQKQLYLSEAAKFPPHAKLVADTDRPGRLNDAAITGIETALLLATNPQTVVLPVDQVGVRPTHLRLLSSIHHAFLDESGPLPFPSLWNQGDLEKLCTLTQSGSLGVRGALCQLDKPTRPVGDYGEEFATNGNTQKELLDYFGTPLMDSYKRRLHYLRFSLTEACNLSCTYCLPDGFPEWKRHKARLPEEDITTLLTGFRRMGFRKLRLTGGEPLVHPACFATVSAARKLGYEDIAITTNGLLLEDVEKWRDAGLTQINISLDTLDPEKFLQITKNRDVQKVLDLVDASIDAGLQVKINAVLMRTVNGSVDQIKGMIDWALARPITLRFIELMDTKLNSSFAKQERVLGSDIIELIKVLGLQQSISNVGPNTSGPADEYSSPDYLGRIGFINPISCNFCSRCNRLRVSAKGRLRMCLFGDGDLPIDLSSPLAVEQSIRACIGDKPEQHYLLDGNVGNVSTFRNIGG